MNNKTWITILGAFLFTFYSSLIFHPINNPKHPVTSQNSTIVSLPQNLPKKLHADNPVWTYCGVLRSVTNLGNILSDIESHMPSKHIYRSEDYVTWAHETSHGLASNLRIKFAGQPKYTSRINGFYVLNNKSVIINEPNTTIHAVARQVPMSLRGMSYDLYMVQQAASWNDSPLYILDEWVAYANGSATRADLKIINRTETVLQMLEFNVYVMTEAMIIRTTDSQFKNFVRWHLERTMRIYKDNQKLGSLNQCHVFWNKACHNQDAANLRQFVRDYYGKEWSSEILGF